MAFIPKENIDQTPEVSAHNSDTINHVQGDIIELYLLFDAIQRRQGRQWHRRILL